MTVDKGSKKAVKAEKKRAKNLLKKLTKSMEIKSIEPGRSYGRVGEVEGLNRAVLQIEIIEPLNRTQAKRGAFCLECTLGRFLGDPQYLYVYLDDEDPLRKVQEFVLQADENAIIAVP